MADKIHPSHRRIAMDTGMKLKAPTTGFKPSTGSSAVVRSIASGKSAGQASSGNSKIAGSAGNPSSRVK